MHNMLVCEWCGRLMASIMPEYIAKPPWYCSTTCRLRDEQFCALYSDQSLALLNKLKAMKPGEEE